MGDYNLWADLLASYRASPDLIKALWLLVPLTIAFGLAALGIAFALRLMEPRRRIPDRTAPGEEEVRTKFSLDAPLIVIEKDTQPVSLR